uniref:CSON000523 protein n=1 Tax=Culicoides sonorensis TaxID=179676 RepID=A0A336MF75_CULSO
MSDKTPLHENPAYEPPDSEFLPVSKDTVIPIPNYTHRGFCPNCGIRGNVESQRSMSQKQHLLAILLFLISGNVALKILLTIIGTIYFISVLLLIVYKLN